MTNHPNRSRQKQLKPISINKYGKRDVYILQDDIRHYQSHMIHLHGRTIRKNGRDEPLSATFQKVNSSNALGGEEWRITPHDGKYTSYTVPAFEYVGPETDEMRQHRENHYPIHPSRW